MLDLARHGLGLGAVVETAPAPQQPGAVADGRRRAARQVAEREGGAGNRAAVADRRSEVELAGAGEGRPKVRHRGRSASSRSPRRLGRIGGGDDVPMRRHRLDHATIGAGGVLELVDEEERESLGDRRPDVGAIAQQAYEGQDHVGGVEAAAGREDPVVAGVELGELGLAATALTLDRVGCRALPALGEVAEGRWIDPLALEGVDPRQQAR